MSTVSVYNVLTNAVRYSYAGVWNKERYKQTWMCMLSKTASYHTHESAQIKTNTVMQF